jgi:GTP cyclohydrolase I
VKNLQIDSEKLIRHILVAIGENAAREGLVETPARVVRSWEELYAGYRVNTSDQFRDLLKVFTDGSCDEMVVLKDIEFQSMCEHHMLPFLGKAHIAYIPDGRILGISKLARLLEVFAKRLQVQERLTQQVTQTLDTYLRPKGSACVIEAHHQCMSCRGVLKQNSTMVTSSLTGAFKDNPETRAEFFGLVR